MNANEIGDRHDDGLMTGCPPVLLVAFNRPEHLRRVIAGLRGVAPMQVFVSVDGPRDGNVRDRDAVKIIRDEVLAELDWGCEVRYQFQEQNLGCRRAVTGGVRWFFSQVDAGIVLEDDCLADPTFFQYAGELLELYRDVPRVMQVCGNDYPVPVMDTSYAFSRKFQPCGWASWSRAWEGFDHTFSLADWPVRRESGWLNDIGGGSKPFERHFRRFFDDLYNDVPRLKTIWSGHWLYHCWSSEGIAIEPSINLISNIGHDGEATLTSDRSAFLAERPMSALAFPLVHPEVVAADSARDVRVFQFVYKIGWPREARLVVKSFLPGAMLSAFKALRARWRKVGR